MLGLTDQTVDDDCATRALTTTQIGPYDGDFPHYGRTEPPAGREGEGMSFGRVGAYENLPSGPRESNLYQLNHAPDLHELCTMKCSQANQSCHKVARINHNALLKACAWSALHVVEEVIQAS